MKRSYKYQVNNHVSSLHTLIYIHLAFANLICHSKHLVPGEYGEVNKCRLGRSFKFNRYCGFYLTDKVIPHCRRADK